MALVQQSRADQLGFFWFGSVWFIRPENPQQTASCDAVGEVVRNPGLPDATPPTL